MRPERRFYIRCAKAFNCRSVKEFLRENDSQDITELMAFYMVEPFGQEWLQTGTVSAEVRRVMTGQKIKAEAYLPIQPPDIGQTPDQMASLFRAMAKEHNQSHVNNRKSKRGAVGNDRPPQ